MSLRTASGLSLSPPVRSVLLSTVALKGIVEVLVATESGSPRGERPALLAFDHLMLCLVIFAFVELAKTLLARVLSLRLHSDALFDEIEARFSCSHLQAAGRRCCAVVLNSAGWHYMPVPLFTPATCRVQEAFKVETVLGKLMAPITAAELRGRSQQIAASRSIPEEKVEQYLLDLYKLSLPVDQAEGQAFTARMAKLIRQVCHARAAAIACSGAVGIQHLLRKPRRTSLHKP